MLGEKCKNICKQIYHKQKDLDYTVYAVQIITHWAVRVLLLLNSATTFFKAWTWGIDSFSTSVRSPQKMLSFQAV